MTAKGAQLPRAYLRMSPNLDQHPDPEGMVILICAANRQPQRGRFRDRVVLARALGTARLKRFAERGDVVQIPGGTWYVEGWDEWQEGDLTVGERQQRIRDRRRDTPVTPSRPSNAHNERTPVTRPLHKRSSPSEAIGGRRESVVLEGERDVVRSNSAPDPEGTVVIGLVDPSPTHTCPTCSHRMVEARSGRWVCTYAPGHGTVAVTA